MSYGSSATSQQSVQNAKKRLNRFLKTVERIPSEVLEEEVDNLYSEIITEVPYRSGKLESSVKVSVSRDRKRPGINASASARASDGFNYAGVQHENTSYHHPKVGAKAHYISDPFNRCIERIKHKIIYRLKF